ncbi:hypothetical protein [Rhodococcus koreensis]
MPDATDPNPDAPETDDRAMIAWTWVMTVALIVVIIYLLVSENVSRTDDSATMERATVSASIHVASADREAVHPHIGWPPEADRRW